MAADHRDNLDRLALGQLGNRHHHTGRRPQPEQRGDRPALARSVYYTTRENQMIREELYAAVAGVLAFVFSLRRGEVWPAAVIDVPVLLRFDADGRLDGGGKS